MLRVKEPPKENRFKCLGAFLWVLMKHFPVPFPLGQHHSNQQVFLGHFRLTRTTVSPAPTPPSPPHPSPQSADPVAVFDRQSLCIQRPSGRRRRCRLGQSPGGARPASSDSAADQGGGRRRRPAGMSAHVTRHRSRVMGKWWERRRSRSAGAGVTRTGEVAVAADGPPATAAARCAE